MCAKIDVYVLIHCILKIKFLNAVLYDVIKFKENVENEKYLKDTEICLKAQLSGCVNICILVRISAHTWFYIPQIENYTEYIHFSSFT